MRFQGNRPYKSQGKPSKPQGIAGFLALSLAIPSLSGCSAFITDEYSAVTPHTVAPLSGDATLIAVESYHELVNALVSFVDRHQTTGKIRLVDYDKDLARAHLSQAVLEVRNETALGSYSVGDIAWETNSIVGSLECDLTITYKVSRSEINQMVGVTGSSTMVRALTGALESMEENLVLHYPYGSNDRGQISTLVHQAYQLSAQSIVEIPQIHTSFYPKEGPWRIVEVEFLYQVEEATRRERQLAVESAVIQKTSQLWVAGEEDMFGQVVESLTRNTTLSTTGDTPWHVLLEGSGDSRGYALAFLALCQELGLTCQMVEGSREGVPQFWNLISPEPGVYHHLDVTQILATQPEEEEGEETSGNSGETSDSPETSGSPGTSDNPGNPADSGEGETSAGESPPTPGYYSQEQMEAQGYSWDITQVPKAVAYER